MRTGGDTPQLLRVLKGLTEVYRQRGEYQTARELAEQCLTLPRANKTPLSAWGPTLIWGCWFNLGELAPAYAHLGQVIALSPPARPLPWFRSGPDPLGLPGYTAWAQWMLGYPDQALTRTQELLAYATESSHAFSLERAKCMLYAPSAPAGGSRYPGAAEAALAIITEQGFGHQVGYATFDRGQGLATQGQGKVGVALMHQGLAAIRAMQQRQNLSVWNALLAEAYGRIGQAEEGLRLLAEALAHMDHTGVRVYEAEVYRLKGELLLQQAVPDVPQAEACFQQALAVARCQQAKSWELRAAMSLVGCGSSRASGPRPGVAGADLRLVHRGL